MRRSGREKAGLAAAAVALALLWAGSLSLAHLEGRATLLDGLEAPLLDLRFQLAGPRPAPDGIVIVALDDDAVREAGAYPVPRATVARLVRELRRRGARSVALDLLFLDAGPPEADRALAEALAEAGAVVAGAGLFPVDGARLLGGSAVPEAEGVLLPVEPIRRAASVGLVNVAADPGGTPRHVPLLLRHGGAVLPSFALRAASRAAGADPVLAGDELTLGEVATRLDLGRHLALRYYGPRRSIRTVGAGSVLRGEVADEVLRDRIAVVGATAIGTGDTFATPFDPVLPGVEVLATAVAHLTTGDGLVRDLGVRRIDAAAALALALGAAFLVALAPLGPALLAVGLAAAGWLAVAAAGFAADLWLSAALPLAALAPPALLGALVRPVLEGRRLRRAAEAERSLRLFHPPTLAARIARDPAFLTRPLEQDAAVLFVDLSGFTGLSESLGAAGTRDLLKEFHGLVDGEATRHGGLVLSFMGDGAMIVFGLADPRPGDAAHALEAALALAERVEAWLARHPVAAARAVGVRVGAHHGPVVASRLGAETHHQITVSGDSVNVASRLMEVAKAWGADLVASGDLLAAAGDPLGTAFDERRAVGIRGRARSLDVALRRARPGPAALA